MALFKKSILRARGPIIAVSCDFDCFSTMTLTASAARLVVVGDWRSLRRRQELHSIALRCAWQLIASRDALARSISAGSDRRKLSTYGTKTS